MNITAATVTEENLRLYTPTFEKQLRNQGSFRVMACAMQTCSLLDQIITA